MPDPAGALWIVAGCNGAPTPNLDRHTGELLRQAGYTDPLTVPADVCWQFFKQADATLQDRDQAAGEEERCDPPVATKRAAPGVLDMDVESQR